ncbi:hypothetical protein [Deinococcus radiopugnans]|uniref:Uncharacterized protein n=1 Tax=Deinococcus radiopugnans ATCC 19172 TaxID=585398 RepID=A0A5C4XIH0_9DEIO|nr:hypothetical protein [Deinococcus radiopugnans]MBB6018834.1 hypothetical protein [Deinococcus radiopugnans ATCC 19172]TNM63216.1 hypothetical protein FHR04_20210 [Deinococcus radiopugnans ATCC 19172]
MTKAVGRPPHKPRNVTVSLAAHHAAELERLAGAHGVKLSTFCAHLLERYSMEDRDMLTSELLKAAVVETVHREMAEHHHRVRSLFARTALESIATRQLARVTLQALLKSDRADTYNEEAWEYAVHVLKNPTPAIKAAIGQLSESISNDDPTLLMRVRESTAQMTAGLGEVRTLAEEVRRLTEQQALVMEMMSRMGETLTYMGQRINDTQRVTITAIEKLEQAEETAKAKKGLFR